MSKIKSYCPECEEWVESDNKICSNCGYDFAEFEIIHQCDIICAACGKVNTPSTEKCIRCGSDVIGCNTLSQGQKGNKAGRNISRADKKRAKQEIAEKEGEEFINKYGNTLRVIFFLLAFVKNFAFFSILIGIALLIEDKKSTAGQKVIDVLIIVFGLLNSITLTLTFM